MFNFPLQSIAQWLLAYKYAVLVPFVIVEGPIVTVIAGFLASRGLLDPYLVYVIAVGGDIVGDTIYYLIGYFGRRRFLRNGSFLKINKERMEKLERFYENHAGKTFLFGKWTQSFGFAILIAAGLASVSFGRYIILNTLGTMPKVLLFLIIGYFFGSNYETIGRLFDQAGVVLAILVGVGLIVFFHWRHRKKNRLP